MRESECVCLVLMCEHWAVYLKSGTCR